MGTYSAVILDLETTGLSPAQGDRAIEIGAVLVRNNRIVDRFESLMNPGVRVSRFIEEYTGITNGMLAGAPPVAEVMRRFAAFMADHRLVAHNSSFDRRFLDSELLRIKVPRRQEFACSMLVSRRVYPDAPSHRLEALVRYKGIPAGIHHRALADAEMTAHLWIGMTEDLKHAFRLRHVPFELMQRLEKLSRRAAAGYLRQLAEERGNSL